MEGIRVREGEEPAKNKGKVAGWREVGKSGRMLARVLVTSYAMLESRVLKMRDLEGCDKRGRADEIFKFIKKADLNVILEFNLIVRGIIMT